MNNNLNLFPEMDKTYVPIVLSLKRKWLESIVQGEKKYEFRRQFLEQPACAFIYTTSPDSHISHIVWFEEPMIKPPEEIVKLKNENRKSLRGYLQDCEKAYAAPVQHYCSIKKITLKEIREKVGKFHPPQSYLRVKNHPALSKFLMERAAEKVRKDTFAPKDQS